LLADDDLRNRKLFAEAFQRSGLEKPLLMVADGEEVIRYLKGEGPFADRELFPLPSILLLDLRMPKCDGIHTLRWIRDNPEFAKLIVVMFSSSGEERDVEESYRCGVNSYIVKPAGFAELVSMIHCINQYWFGCST